MDLKGKNVLVVGLGRSGLASARFLKKHGAFVIGFDEKAEEQFKEEEKMMHKSYLMKSIIVRFLMNL